MHCSLSLRDWSSHTSISISQSVGRLAGAVSEVLLQELPLVKKVTLPKRYTPSPGRLPAEDLSMQEYKRLAPWPPVWDPSALQGPEGSTEISAAAVSQFNFSLPWSWCSHLHKEVTTRAGLQHTS